MDSVIKKLQDLTQSDSRSLVELVDIFASKYPNKGITLIALKDYAFNDSSQKISQKSIMDILAQIH